MKYLFNSKILKDYIKKHNLTPEEFCKKCGIRLNVFYRLVDSKSSIGMITANLLCRLADYLGVKVEDLIIKINK